MKKPQLLDIISKLSPDAFAYFFPGAIFPEVTEDVVLSLPDDGGISFKASINSNANVLKEADFERITLDVFPERLEKHKIKGHLDVLHNLEDEPHDQKTQALLEEIKALQKKYGVSIDELEAVLSYTVKLSRLRITRRHEIILEDFNKREVKMVPLTKAIFLLYLAHPEGIRFKDLGDYRQELERIYMSISGRSDLQAMKKSLERLTNSVTSNSINEKVSKVSKAFREVVDDRIARFYYIEGKSGEPKKIALDRSLVIWE